MNNQKLKTVSMPELYDTIFDPQMPLIDSLLFRGTYLFVGAPKVGKSFMMAQLAFHVSTGTPLWDYPVRKATVLYFALEDDYPRLQKRLLRMFGANESDNLYLATKCKTINGRLEEQIQEFMAEHPDTGLIIIDTLKRVREATDADYSYAGDYDMVSKLKALADSYNVTMLIVHHTRKQRSEDIFDMISGTNGLMGAADGAFVLYKEKRTSNAATLDIVGRDQQDNKLYLEKDNERLVWNFIKAETEAWKEPPDPTLEKIAEIFLSGGDRWEGTASQLREVLEMDMKPNTLSTYLHNNQRRLFRDHGIHFHASRTHAGRKVSLWKEGDLNMTKGVNRDDDFDTPTGV